jgi:hypothetical protein
MQRLSNYAPEGSIRRYLISCENADLKRSCNKGTPCRWRVRFTSQLRAGKGIKVCYGCPTGTFLIEFIQALMSTTVWQWSLASGLCNRNSPASLQGER